MRRLYFFPVLYILLVEILVWYVAWPFDEQPIASLFYGTVAVGIAMPIGVVYASLLVFHGGQVYMSEPSIYWLLLTSDAVFIILPILINCYTRSRPRLARFLAVFTLFLMLVAAVGFHVARVRGDAMILAGFVAFFS
jgi:hypothetical protein